MRAHGYSTQGTAVSGDEGQLGGVRVGVQEGLSDAGGGVGVRRACVRAIVSRWNGGECHKQNTLCCHCRH